MPTVGDFLASGEYVTFIGNDSSFPLDSSIQNIIEYLSAKYPEEILSPNSEHAQSQLYYFANNWFHCKQEIDAADDRDDDYKDSDLIWDYPTAKQMYRWINEVKMEDGITQEEDGDWILQLKENVKVWLSLLKISLTTEPFNESLQFNEDRDLLVPRLTADKKQIGFHFVGTDAYEDLHTREETLLFLIQQMGDIYKERGNFKGYNNWMEHCRVYLQSVLTTPL